MKKLLICLLCVNFITFISFASSNGSEISDIGEDESFQSSPQVTETQLVDEIESSEAVFPEIPEQTDTVKANQPVSITRENIEKESVSDTTEKLGELLYPDPAEIKDPKIITLEPDDDYEKEELVTTELPPLDDEINENISDDKIKEEKKVEIKETNNVLKATNKDNNENKSEVAEEKSKNKTQSPVAEKEPLEENLQEEKQAELEENVQLQETETVAEEIIEPVIDVITPSRSVNMKMREFIDVTYPGTGWIYIGIVDGSKDLSYFGRDIGTKNTTFTLQAKVPGTKVLHFCKNDYLTGEYIDDYIEVVILPEEGSNKTHIMAPDYKQPEPKIYSKQEEKTESSNITVDSVKENLPEAEKTGKEDSPQVNNTMPETGDTSVSNKGKENSITRPVEIPTPKQDITFDNKKSLTTEEQNADSALINDEELFASFEEDGISIPEEEVIEISENSDTSDCNTLLKEANFLYNEGEFKTAYDKVNTYLDFATSNIDEGLLLKGKILESRSELQDIKAAIKVYNTLMEEYPASVHWNEANKRVIYLKRFYLEVR